MGERYPIVDYVITFLYGAIFGALVVSAIVIYSWKREKGL